MKTTQQIIKENDDLKKAIKSYLLLWDEYYKSKDPNILKRMNMMRNELKLRVS